MARRTPEGEPDTQQEPQPLVHGTEQAQEVADRENEQGYRGVKVDPLPDSAHSLQSGPNAPTVAEQMKALKGADND